MYLRFWGVRGSIPVPGVETLETGGNTSCVSVEHDDRIVIFDAGSGIRRLGSYLGAAERKHWRGCIFLSHYHWDHIQGLPFFAPAFREEMRFHLFGEEKKGVDLFEILAEQMEAPYFPVGIDQQKGLVTFNQIEPGDNIELGGGMIVRTMRLNHPNGAIGYRLENERCSVCIITDHEHRDEEPDPAVVEFARGSTVLIHEAPYSHEQLQSSRKGWGHSSWRQAALVARYASVKQLYITHHDPGSTDGKLGSALPSIRAVFSASELATEKTEVAVDKL